MKIDLNKIEFDMNEYGALLLQDKQEGFRLIGEKFLNAVLEKEFSEHIGAQKHERTGEREDYRNGHKERRLKTTLGELNLLRPYARTGKFDTKLFKNYSRIDKALSSIIVESYLKGGLFKNLCQPGKITITQGHKNEYRNKCRAVCS